MCALHDTNSARPMLNTKNSNKYWYELSNERWDCFRVHICSRIACRLAANAVSAHLTVATGHIVSSCDRNRCRDKTSEISSMEIGSVSFVVVVAVVVVGVPWTEPVCTRKHEHCIDAVGRCDTTSQAATAQCTRAERTKTHFVHFNRNCAQLLCIPHNRTSRTWVAASRLLYCNARNYVLFSRWNGLFVSIDKHLQQLSTWLAI